MADAVVVGSGPNGLAAAIALAQAGRSVTVLEGADTLGGGCRSAELTLPGFVHDTCSTVHALALASPFLSSLPLAEHGFEPVHPGAPLAHPLDDGTAVMLERSVDQTAAGLGPDARPTGACSIRWCATRRRSSPSCSRRCVRRATRCCSAASALSAHPVRLRARPLALRGRARPRAAGGMQRALDAVPARPGHRGVRLVLAVSAHAVGWPVARGGSQRLADALAATCARWRDVETGQPVESLDELARHRRRCST